MLTGCLLQQTRHGLAAVAAVLVIMPTGVEAVQSQLPRQMTVDVLHGFSGCFATGHVGLIGHHQIEEAILPEPQQGFPHPIQNAEIFQTLGGVRLAVFYHRLVDHSVPVQENGPFQRVADSHLVALAFSLGCETSRCQITAWKASLWGVMVSGFTVGMMQQASATLAV